MQPKLYSYDISHILHWESCCKEIGCTTLYEKDELMKLKDELIVLAYEKEFEPFVKEVMQNNKVLVLDPMPTLYKAKQVFTNGARGYGNTLMSKVYMHSAFETIKSENIWFIPTLTKEFIQSMQTQSYEETTQEVLKNLTPKEQEIALLLKEGLYNQEIAKKLDVSINTVKSHIKSVYSKLGVKDKFSFVMLFK